LDTDPRVLLVQYEDAVMDKERAFRWIFDFLGFPFEPGITGEVYESSVGRYPWPGIDPAIERVCEARQATRDARCAGIGDRPTLPGRSFGRGGARLVHRVEPPGVAHVLLERGPYAPPIRRGRPSVAHHSRLEGVPGAAGPRVVARPVPAGRLAGCRGGVAQR